MKKKDKRGIRIKKLKKALEITAFASLIADICISLLTLTSLYVGKSKIVGILFVFNYILVVIVVASLILIAGILISSHYHKLSKIISLFNFKTK